MHLSIVSPVYRAERILSELVRQITEVSREIAGDSYEIILVEDYGPDRSREVISNLCGEDPHVKGVFLSRNFGQQYAINAGLDCASGEWVVTLDCDLQDTPARIRQLYDRAREGYEIVFASRQHRQDGFVKKCGSKIFNRLLSFLTGVPQDSSIANFVLYQRKAVDAMKQMGDYRRYYPLMNHWIGFRTITEPIPHADRADGKSSSYTLRKRLHLAFNTIVAFSDKPLRLILSMGIWIVLLAFLGAIGLIVHYLVSGITVSGWLTLFVSVWFIAGILIILLGIIGIYIGKIYESVKARPSYIIQNKINL